jgi:hypothetical protein
MPDPACSPIPESCADRTCLALACAIPVAWFFIFNAARPDYLVDEGGHMGNIYHFLEGKPGWPEQMTMLPGYHFIVAALWQLHPPIRLLSLSRLLCALSAVLATLSFAYTWRKVRASTPQQSAGAGRAALLFSLLPILQPFSALAYTDYPALCFVLVAFHAQVSGQRWLAAFLFAGAVCLRQTNLLWAAFAVGWEIFRQEGQRQTLWPRVRGLLLLLGVAFVVVRATGRTTVGTQTGTDLRFNPTALHFGAVLGLLLALPALAAAIPGAVSRVRSTTKRHLLPTLAITAVAVGAAAVLAVTFSNPHQWNRDLTWPGCTFTLLRNWPLVWIDAHPWLRVASAMNLVLMSAAAGLLVMGQPQRRALMLALAAGAAFPLANSLVEPRYFIPGAALTLLFVDFTPTTLRRLAIWWAVLDVVHAPFIARGLSLW